jgi:hypothetical protein
MPIGLAIRACGVCGCSELNPCYWGLSGLQADGRPWWPQRQRCCSWEIAPRGGTVCTLCAAIYDEEGNEAGLDHALFALFGETIREASYQIYYLARAFFSMCSHHHQERC